MAAARGGLGKTVGGGVGEKGVSINEKAEKKKGWGKEIEKKAVWSVFMVCFFFTHDGAELRARV